MCVSSLVLGGCITQQHQYIFAGGCTDCNGAWQPCLPEVGHYMVNAALLANHMCTVTAVVSSMIDGKTCFCAGAAPSTSAAGAIIGAVGDHEGMRGAGTVQPPAPRGARHLSRSSVAAYKAKLAVQQSNMLPGETFHFSMLLITYMAYLVLCSCYVILHCCPNLQYDTRSSTYMLMMLSN